MLLQLILYHVALAHHSEFPTRDLLALPTQGTSCSTPLSRTPPSPCKNLLPSAWRRANECPWTMRRYVPPTTSTWSPHATYNTQIVLTVLECQGTRSPKIPNFQSRITSGTPAILALCILWENTGCFQLSGSQRRGGWCLSPLKSMLRNDIFQKSEIYLLLKSMF